MAASNDFSIRFHVFFRGDFVPIEKLLGRAELLLEDYLDQERLSCCDFQGGFFIDVDSEPWSDSASVDEFWMTLTWLRALILITRGAKEAEARPWEESTLHLTREDDVLTLRDFQGAVSVPSLAFCQAFFIEAAKWLQLVDEMHMVVTTREQDAPPSIASKLEIVAQEFFVEELKEWVSCLGEVIATSRLRLGEPPPLEI